MLQKFLSYLGVGWEIIHNLHTAQWIVAALIAVLPASATTALIAVLGEHSIFLLCIAFLLCFGIISMMTLALLGHPSRLTGNRAQSVSGRAPVVFEPSSSAQSEARELRGERYRPQAPDNTFTVVEALPEVPDNETTLIWKRKLRVSLRNSSGKNIEVRAPDWLCSRGDVPFETHPTDRFWSILQPEISAGRFGKETAVLQVGINEIFQASVALDESFSIEEVRVRRTTQRVGMLILPVTIDDHQMEWRRRL
jgi:hypothetical protein